MGANEVTSVAAQRIDIHQPFTNFFNTSIELTSPGLFRGDDGLRRCAWCRATPAYQAYHDHEWGMPVDDDRTLFEKICLEGFQAGLSWLTILNKREAFRSAFANFEADQIVTFNTRDVSRLMSHAGIVRHRGKIESTINNAQRMKALQQEFGSFAWYVWQFEPVHLPRPSRLTADALRALPIAQTAQELSRDLKHRGWTFVGPTTVYAFMQAMGLVNDHLDGCFAQARVAARRQLLEAHPERP